MRAYTPKPPTFGRKQAERLRAVAQHLSYGKLSKVEFDFSRVNRGKNPMDIVSSTECGYAGCVLGEFHVIFPEKYAGKFYVGLGDPTPDGVESFLGLTSSEAHHLFIPGAQDPGIPGALLNIDATRFAVAANIRKFIRHKGF